MCLNAIALMLFAADVVSAPAVAYELKCPAFTAVIGDNGAAGDHGGGYNGVFRIEAPGVRTPFVPLYAGLNLEHYFDARPRPEERTVLFEPRNAPMTCTRIDDRTVELYQPETPFYGVESRTRFRIADPYYIEVTFTCIPHKPVEGFLGCFWASYINAPEDKSIYFLAEGATTGAPKWTQFCTQQHNRDSTVLPGGAKDDITFQPGPGMLYNNLSPLRYGEPFFYGRVDGMVVICMFERGANVRLAHSPSGGGKTADGTDTNPAWDFQYLVPGAEVGVEYHLRMRMAFKPWAGRADVLHEVTQFWTGSAGSDAK